MHLIVIVFFLKFLSLAAIENNFITLFGMPVEIEKGLCPDKKLIVVAFGNSITAPRKNIHQVYAQRLPPLLASEGIVAEVINAGAPGSHTGSIKDHSLFKIQHGMDRFKSDVLVHHPDMVIIGFGTNDAHIDGSDPNGPSRIPVKDYERNLIFMIKALQEKQAKVILIAPNALGNKFPDYQNERLREYVKTVRQLSKTYQTGLLDNFELFMEFQENTGRPMEDLLLDGVHPNDLGHKFMAEELAKEIIQIIN